MEEWAKQVAIQFLKKSILKGYFKMPSLEFVCLPITAHVPATKGREWAFHLVRSQGFTHSDIMNS